MNKSEILYGWKPYIYTESDTITDALEFIKVDILFKTKEECDAYIASIPNHTKESYSYFTINNEDCFADYIENNLFHTASTHNLLQLYKHDLDLFLAIKNLFPDIPNDFLKRKLFYIQSYLEDYIDNCIHFYREDN